MDAALKKKRERETNHTPNMTMVSVLPTSQGHSWNEMFIKEGREGGGRERERERGVTIVAQWVKNPTSIYP